MKMITSRRINWAGNIVRMGEMRNAFKVLVGKPERKRRIGTYRRMWKDNIKMELTEI
jgi:hypothetical protein